LPFAAFMACIGGEELLRFIAGRGWVALSPDIFLYTYPVRIFLVVGLLVYYRKQYVELKWADVRNVPMLLLALLSGILVFVVWIGLSACVFSGVPKAPGYNPLQLPSAVQLPLVIVRIVGASFIVPIMEELFWRSFLLRYLVDVDFESVPLGTYTLSSFLITIILFGFEHHLILAGIAAGLAYNLLLYKTRSLALCIVSHSITNIILAGYVVCYMRWDLW